MNNREDMQSPLSLLTRRSRLALALLLGWGCGTERPRVAASGSTVTATPTGERVSCDGCMLTLRRIGTFPLGDDDTLIGPRAHLTVLEDGGALMAPVVPSGGIARFDAGGRLARVRGRSGGGPGELQDVFDLTPIGDSVLVASRGRLTLFGPELVHPDARYA